MKIKEYEWLRENRQLLSDEDAERLEELNVFQHLEIGKIEMPVTEYVKVLQELSTIVAKYQNCSHEAIVKVYRATEKHEEDYPKKKLVILCEGCGGNAEDFLGEAQEIIDLTGDDLK